MEKPWTAARAKGASVQGSSWSAIASLPSQRSRWPTTRELVGHRGGAVSESVGVVVGIADVLVNLAADGDRVAVGLGSGVDPGGVGIAARGAAPGPTGADGLAAGGGVEAQGLAQLLGIVV